MVYWTLLKHVSAEHWWVLSIGKVYSIFFHYIHCTYTSTAGSSWQKFIHSQIQPYQQLTSFYDVCIMYMVELDQTPGSHIQIQIWCNLHLISEDMRAVSVSLCEIHNRKVQISPFSWCGILTIDTLHWFLFSWNYGVQCRPQIKKLNVEQYL